MSDFPVDDTTLALLEAACTINPDNGRTNLGAFLDMGSRMKSRTDVTDEVEGASATVYFTEYEEGYEPHSPISVILALIAEVQRVRTLLDVAAREAAGGNQATYERLVGEAP